MVFHGEIKRMKVLLTLSPDFFPSAFKWAPVTSLLHLGASIENQDCEIKILDPILEGMSYSTYLDVLIREAPDVMGMSATSDTYFTAAKVIKEVKTRLPKTRTILGGAHATLLGASLFDDLPELDILVCGEGDHAFPQIIETLKKGESLKGVPNTSFRENGSVVCMKEKKIIQDLDSLPFPAFHLAEFDRYDYTYPVDGKGEVRAINLVTTRGCPFDCLFCSNTNLFERKVRYRSIENVIEEIKLRIEQYNIEFFWIQDDTFNLSSKRVFDFCDALEKENLEIHWSCIMRADNAKFEILSRMKEVGFVGGYFAIETVDDHLRQKILGKKLTQDHIMNTIDIYNKLNCWCGINFLVSIPDETKENMEDNISFIENLHLNHEFSSVNLNILRIYPGTRLETQARNRNVLKDGFTWHDEKKMRKYSPGNLPGLYGIVPVYKEHLSYVDIFTAVFRWKYSPNFSIDPGKGNSLFRYLWIYVKHIRRLKDVYLLSQIGVAWLKVLLLRAFEGKKKDSST